ALCERVRMLASGRILAAGIGTLRRSAPWRGSRSEQPPGVSRAERIREHPLVDAPVLALPTEAALEHRHPMIHRHGRKDAMLSNPDLWQCIQDFPIDDPGDAFSFSARLAHENGWSGATAAAAIEEYRKFIYLIGVSDSPLTPSEAVDQVWHLHLLYTRSYWTEFCGGVLCRPLHHEPTRGGAGHAAAG